MSKGRCRSPAWSARKAGSRSSSRASTSTAGSTNPSPATTAAAGWRSALWWRLRTAVSLTGELTFRGDPSATYGAVNCRRGNRGWRPSLPSAPAGRPLPARRHGGTFVMVGDYAANSATLDPAMMAGITGPLAAAATTPIGPVATSMRGGPPHGGRFRRERRVPHGHFPGGGRAARIGTAQVTGPNGARVAIGGRRRGDLYWPAGRIRVDGRWRLAAAVDCRPVGSPSITRATVPR